jgi:YidC/Oxa1 family membrane protein insertase
VRLHWRSSDGVEVDKVYTFHRGSYVVDVAYVVKNDSSSAWTGHMYNQLQSTEPAKKKHAFTHTYNGGAIYSPEKKYEKVSYEDMKEKSLSEQITGGWAAVLEHYFFGAWIPSAKEAAHYYTKALSNGRYLIGMIGPGFSVAPGASGKAEARLYVGPKEQTTLADIAPGLELTVDYGRLTFLAKPIFAAMEFIHKIVGNWGWSIILLTMLIKLAFYKLSATSYRSMANMRKMQPRMKALKERFGDDKQKLNEAMMKMYKEEKINPLGGCLPIVVQIPVFIALYWVLLESVELRQAPFILWIHDLSTADPYYVLPLIMGVTMLIQQRLNPSPLDPIQQKVMMILPVVFTVFFAFFPAGLVLYWVVNNTLSITQQWYITRSLDKA